MVVIYQPSTLCPVGSDGAYVFQLAVPRLSWPHIDLVQGLATATRRLHCSLGPGWPLGVPAGF